MSRILLCWEMGSNTGHVRHLSWLGQAFEARGHQVQYCLKTPEAGAHILPERAVVTAAPLPDFPPPSQPPPRWNYTSLLRLRGFHEPTILQPQVTRWVAAMESAEPDFVVTDHAPTAVLAARCLGLPHATLGIGFLVPPLTFPMPLCHWWPGPGPSRAQLRQEDRAVAASASTLLAEYGQPEVECVADLLRAPVRALTTVPALDDYTERPADEAYFGTWGAESAAAGAVSPDWPAGEGPRVLGYLRTRYRPFPALIHALHTQPVRALIHVPDCTPEQAEQWSSDRIRLIREPLNLSTLAPSCDFALGYGGGGFSADLLKLGKPMLLAPAVLQQEMVSRRVVKVGAGLLAGPQADYQQIAGLLHRLSTESTFAERADDLAHHIAQWPMGRAMENQIVDACETYLCQ